MKQLSWLHVNQMDGIFFNTGWEAILTVGDLLGRCFKLKSIRAMESNVPMGDLFCFFCLTASYLWFRHFRITVHEALLLSWSSLCLRVFHARVKRVSLFHLMHCRPAQF